MENKSENTIKGKMGTKVCTTKYEYLKGINFESITVFGNEISLIFNNYKDSIIMVVEPSYNPSEKKGIYKVALIYRNYKKIYEGCVEDINSANKCAIQGLIEGAKHITKEKDVILVTGTCFGFQKALKDKGVNKFLWMDLFEILKEVGCCKVTEVVVVGGGEQIALICKN